MQILLIDGNYFCHRLIHFEDIMFKDDLEKDREKFFKSCITSMWNEIENIPTPIDHVIFAIDYDSWRKGVSMEFPELYPEELKVNYKYNREITEKLYDKKQFYIAMSDFFEKMKSTFNFGHIKVQGAESDDIVAIVAEVFSKSTKINNPHIICWTSDGDYPQLVSDKVSIMKLPNKVFYTNKVVRNKTMMSIFENKVVTTKNRTLSAYLKVNKNGTKEVHSELILLCKVAGGDTKDNVPSTYMWESSTKTRVYSVSDKQCENTLVELNISPFDLKREMFSDVNFIRTFMTSLFYVSGAYKGSTGFDKKIKSDYVKSMLLTGSIDEVQTKAIEKIKDYSLNDFYKYIENCKIDIEKGIKLFVQNKLLKTLDSETIPEHLVESIKNSLFKENGKRANMKPFYESQNKVFEMFGLQQKDDKVFGNSFGHLNTN